MVAVYDDDGGANKRTSQLARRGIECIRARPPSLSRGMRGTVALHAGQAERGQALRTL